MRGAGSAGDWLFVWEGYAMGWYMFSYVYAYPDLLFNM